MVPIDGLSGKERVMVILSTIASFALVMGLAATLTPAPPEYSTPKFYGGEIVAMKAHGVRGMVVSNRCPVNPRPCTYSVRFSAMQARTNVSLFGSDGPIDTAPVALVSGIHEFELEIVE